MSERKCYLLGRTEIIIEIETVITFIIAVTVLFLFDISYIKIFILIWMIQFGIVGVIFYYTVYKPLKCLNKLYVAFSDGFIMQDIFGYKYEINREHEKMMRHLETLIGRKQMIEISKQHAEYLALQNQINPHFLYNTLEGIRSEALIGGLPNVAEMAEVLARYFRYTISNLKTLVAVDNELNNVKNYCLIQQFRFGDKISLKICFQNEEEFIKRCKVPKLILQPIVENSIRHGIEPLERKGVVTIRLSVTDRRLIIVVSDNGVGIDKERLEGLNEDLKRIIFDYDKTRDKEGGIAMMNVNSRIKLVFGEQYGIQIFSVKSLGTDVEITLPVKLDD